MTPDQASQHSARICGLAPVIPVLVVDDAARAKGLAQALVTGGLPALEVTLRTPAALDAIREMAGKVEGSETLARLHALSKLVHEAIDYRKGATTRYRQ